MDKLILKPSVAKLLTFYNEHPPHALFLSGEKGVGLFTISATLAKKITKKSTDITILSPEKDSIAIERIRGLYELTRSIQKSARVVIIDDADTLSIEAQNALLKLLEEPVENIHFILTSHSPQNILPTIISRTQRIDIPPVTRAQSKQLLENKEITAEKVAQILFLAAGKPAEIHRLLEDSEYFENQVVSMQDARSVLNVSLYDRLKISKKYSGDRSAALNFIALIGKLLHFTSLKQRNLYSVGLLSSLEQAASRIHANGHVKTHMAYLMTKLGK